MHTKRLLIIAITTALLLLIPLISMQFTNEVNWNLADFMIAAALIFGTGLLIELVLQKTKKISHRVFLLAILIVTFFLIWAELAVGIFGSPLSGQ